MSGDTRPARQVDFGWWAGRDGRRYLLSWSEDTGMLTMDGDVVGWVETEEEVRSRLEGWHEHIDSPGALIWLAWRLEGCR